VAGVDTGAAIFVVDVGARDGHALVLSPADAAMGKGDIAAAVAGYAAVTVVGLARSEAVDSGGNNSYTNSQFLSGSEPCSLKLKHRLLAS